MFYDAVKNDHGFQNDPFKAIVAPRPIGWISSLGPDGSANLAPYSFFNAVSESPHYVVFGSGAAKGPKDSQRNAAASGEFAVNLATYDLREQMNASAASVPPDVDEFVLAGLAKAPCRIINAPRVAESPVCLECRVFQVVHLPDDQGGGDSAQVAFRALHRERFEVLGMNGGHVDTDRDEWCTIKFVALLTAEGGADSDE